MEIFPETVRKLWNDWQIRVLVLLSLTLQIILIVLGNRRKYSANTWLRAVLWVTYLSSDRVATVALGVLSNNLKEYSDKSGAAITAFWAPFLLVHLGGPDTITAYSLEDNELWRRHFLELLVQVGVALYVFLKSWTSGTSYLLILSIPMFVAGIIKYRERTWTLRSSSYGLFKDYDFDRSSTSSTADIDTTPYDGFRAGEVDDKDIPGVAYYLFDKFKCLYSDVLCRDKDIKFSSAFFSSRSSREGAFGVIELELGFMFDVLFTKASMIWSSSIAGCILRVSSFGCSVGALVAFTLTHKHGFHSIDVLISYALLVGAVTLEIYAMVLLFFSDWAVVWLKDLKRKSALFNPIYCGLTTFIVAVNKCCGRKSKRWSRKAGQFNLISMGLRATRVSRIYHLPLLSSRNRRLPLLIWFSEWKEGWQPHMHVSGDLMELIFDHVKTMQGDYVQARPHIPNPAGSVYQVKAPDDDVLAMMINDYQPGDYFRDLENSDFRALILILHIATDLCIPYAEPTSLKDDPHLNWSKLLSDYMLYLLAVHPSMLPKGIGKYWYQGLLRETTEIVNESCKNLRDEAEARTEFQSGCTKQRRNPDNLSMVVRGSRLAEELGKLETRKWERICGAWVEMLCFAAKKCEWRSGHAPQLATGGELLTHVALLLSHFGLSDQTRHTLADDGATVITRRL